MPSEPEDKAIDLNSYLTFRLSRVQAKLNAHGARFLKKVAGLTLAQWRIIVLLSLEGETTSSALSRLAGIDKGLLSRKLKTLVDQGLVRTLPHSDDGRVLMLSLTDAGKRVFEKTLPHSLARQEWLRSQLDAQELQVFYQALDKLEAAVDAKDAP
jgi:DNA-binding MarR family transcriptional regulator